MGRSGRWTRRLPAARRSRTPTAQRATGPCLLHRAASGPPPLPDRNARFPAVPRSSECAVAVTHRLFVDPIRCDGRGICAELFPERILLDDWGYPIVDSTPLDRSQLRDARRAV